jgi:hypothetical protein
MVEVISSGNAVLLPRVPNGRDAFEAPEQI